ncbi:zinc finger protein 879-like [Topomyia yanbarensis]|uniref:zinc finger protein 879-like n=1 Tax=Topomyia yanbarensis TaxID=2498891 RepID=UPI00273AEE71|nr:zinc finger protein 879-like [Topomyia yanbarensis]
MATTSDMDLCRLCLTDDGIMCPIFGNERSNLAQKIFECTSIQVEKIAGVPSSICEVCKSKLIICLEFIRQCSKADADIRLIYAEHFELHESTYARNGTKFDRQEDPQGLANEEVEIINVLPCEEGELQTNELFDNAQKDNGSIVIEIVEHQSQPDKLEDLHEETVIVELETVEGDKKEVLEETIKKTEKSEEEVPIDEGKHSVKNKNRRETSGKVRQVSKKRRSKDTTDNKSNVKKYKKECPICHVPQQNLKQHMLLHSGIKKHVCQYCKKAFTQRGNLTCHLNIHTGNKPHKCDQCDKSFGDPTALKMHKVIHTDEPSFQCDICSKHFKYRHSLLTHIRSHNDDRRHACTYCSMAFVTSSSLKKHVRKHTGERPYKCEQCSKSFTSSGNLQTHRRSHAKKTRPSLEDSSESSTDRE